MSGVSFLVGGETASCTCLRVRQTGHLHAVRPGKLTCEVLAATPSPPSSQSERCQVGVRVWSSQQHGHPRPAASGPACGQAPQAAVCRGVFGHSCSEPWQR